MPLPKWVKSNAESLRDEAAAYVGLTAEQRAFQLAACCRAGIRLLKARSDWSQMLERTDALPASTVEALARQRALKKSMKDEPR